MKDLDLVIRGGTVVTATDEMRADVGIRDGRIVAVAEDLPDGARTIDATGRLVMPGGLDTHCHIEQLSASGIRNADTFESATRAAALGGTTTVIPFACQHRGDDLAAVARDYHALAARGAMVDYALHLIVTDPTDKTMDEDLPRLVGEGHASIKVFMTYPAMRLEDEALLDVLLKARALSALVCVHAENHGMIAWLASRLAARGHDAPRYHAVAHTRASEAEAISRMIALAELVDQPVMIFHVSTAEGAAAIRAARGRGLKVWGETCPQYLFLTEDDLDRPGVEGAKWCCSPPPRTVADQEALWQALRLGDLQTVTSDHAPFAFDGTGKLVAGPEPSFRQIPNGLPGLQFRLPLLFDAMVSEGRMDARAFVRLVATDAAFLYGLHDRKGSIAVGRDADVAIWDAERTVTLSDDLVADRTGYTPYAGRTVRGWPETVLVRGQPVVENGRPVGRPGEGRFLPRAAGPAARPTGRPSPAFDPGRAFGASLS